MEQQIVEREFSELSDKSFWHRYLAFYEPFFARLDDARQVLEYGVARGASIRYLSERFPGASIVGCDILTPLPEWPRSDRITYVTIDQGKVQMLERLLHDHPGPFDLVIEDGSHDPRHQRNCLVTTLPHVRPEGIYVLEDLHTSHPDYPALSGTEVNCFNLLLTFEHLLATGQELSESVIRDLTTNSLFTAAEVMGLSRFIGKVALFRRASLPLRCYLCGSKRFSYGQLRCHCGTELIRGVDSITAVITTPPASAPVTPEFDC